MENFAKARPSRLKTWAAGVASALVILLTVRAISARRDDGPVSIHKMGGGIDVDEAPHGAELFTMGGGIHLGSVANMATLKTLGGDIDVDQASGSLHASTNAGNITARLLPSSSSKRDIDLSSNQGEISLIVPKDFPMSVDITLAYTNNQSENFRVISNLGLKTTQTSSWDSTHGTPRKYIYATARVGSGANRVVIHTINGNVTLKNQ